jgi:hypothetical protein
MPLANQANDEMSEMTKMTMGLAAGTDQRTQDAVRSNITDRDIATIPDALGSTHSYLLQNRANEALDRSIAAVHKLIRGLGSSRAGGATRAPARVHHL